MAPVQRIAEAGTYEVLIGRATAAQAIRHTEYRTDVIGSNTRLAGASLEMIDLPGREGRLRKALAEVQERGSGFVYRLAAQSGSAHPQRPERLRQCAHPGAVRVLCAGRSVGAHQHPQDHPQKV